MKRNCEERDKFLARNEVRDRTEKSLKTMVSLDNFPAAEVYQLNLRVNLFYKTVDEHHHEKIHKRF